MLKLYWCKQTRAVRALWMVEELGEPYELVPIDIYDTATEPDREFLSASPMRKVPALTDGQARLAESAAICLYLADRYPNANLAPKFDDPLRARYLYWMMYTPSIMEPAAFEKMTGGEPNKLSHGWGDFDAMVDALSAALSPGPWLLGSTFSAADVMVGSSTHFLKLMGVLPDINPLNAYVESCLARPAYQRALQKDGPAQR